MIKTCIPAASNIPIKEIRNGEKWGKFSVAILGKGTADKDVWGPPSPSLEEGSTVGV